MGKPAPGSGNSKSAPFSRKYDNPSAVDLTEAVAQAKCATSALLLIATAADAALTYKDCSGTAVAITDVPDGAVLYLPIAATTLDSSTTMDVIAFWHGA